MNKVYGRILLLTLFILVISGVVIYSTVDINTIRNLHVFQPWSVALAIYIGWYKADASGENIRGTYYLEAVCTGGFW